MYARVGDVVGAVVEQLLWHLAQALYSGLFLKIFSMRDLSIPSAHLRL